MSFLLPGPPGRDAEPRVRAVDEPRGSEQAQGAGEAQEVRRQKETRQTLAVTRGWPGT